MPVAAGYGGAVKVPKDQWNVTSAAMAGAGQSKVPEKAADYDRETNCRASGVTNPYLQVRLTTYKYQKCPNRIVGILFRIDCHYHGCVVHVQDSFQLPLYREGHITYLSLKSCRSHTGHLIIKH